jgi:hypothetical protein
MTIKKNIKLLFTFFLALVFLFESLTAGVCLCWRCFPVACQNVELKLGSRTDKGPFNNIAKSCNFEKSKSAKGVYLGKQTVRSKNISKYKNSDSAHFFAGFESQYSLRYYPTCVRLLASPIFLKNLSIRC